MLSRRAARAGGMIDCIHYAPDWDTRATALFAQLSAAGEIPDHIGMIPGGRMACTGKLGICSVVEHAGP